MVRSEDGLHSEAVSILIFKDKDIVSAVRNNGRTRFYSPKFAIRLQPQFVFFNKIISSNTIYRFVKSTTNISILPYLT